MTGNYGKLGILPPEYRDPDPPVLKRRDSRLLIVIGRTYPQAHRWCQAQGINLRRVFIVDKMHQLQGSDLSDVVIVLLDGAQERSDWEDLQHLLTTRGRHDDPVVLQMWLG